MQKFEVAEKTEEQETSQELNVEQYYLVNASIKAKRYKIYLPIIIILTAICIVLRIILFAFIIIHRSFFKQSITIIMETWLSGFSFLLLVIVLILSIRNRSEIKKDQTYDMENPFVSFCIRYTRAALLFQNLLIFGMGFSYAIQIQLEYDLKVFNIIHSIEVIFELGLLIIALYQAAIGYDIPKESKKMRAARQLFYKDGLKVLPYPQ